MTAYEGHIVMVDGVKYKSVNGQWVPFGSQVIASGKLPEELSREINESYLDFFSEPPK